MKHTEEIIKAWGDRYEIYKDYINHDGWVLNNVLGDALFVLTESFQKGYIGPKNKEFDYNYIAFRPLELSLIELAKKNKNSAVVNFQIMNREELLELREAYINAEPYRIIDKWFDDYIKHGHTAIVMSNYKDDVKEDVKRILEEKGFKVKEIEKRFARVKY